MEVEKDLILKAVSGDRLAFGQVVELSYDAVFHFCYKYCGHREDAEDIAQEVFTKLGSTIFNFKGNSSFKTWLFAIAVNTSKDHFRKIKAKKETAFDEGFEVESGSASQEQVLHSKQLLRAIADLPQKIKDAVMLVCSEGFSHAEAGRVLGCSEGTISWRIHEARKTLAAFKSNLALTSILILVWIWTTIK